MKLQVLRQMEAGEFRLMCASLNLVMFMIKTIIKMQTKASATNLKLSATKATYSRSHLLEEMKRWLSI